MAKRTNNEPQNIHIKLKTGGELRCSGRVSSSCSTSGTRCGNLVTNPLIMHEWGKDRKVFTTSGTYPWSFAMHVFHWETLSHNVFEYTSRFLEGFVLLDSSLVLCVCFVDRCLSFCTFSFSHCVVCSCSIYGFWYPFVSSNSFYGRSEVFPGYSGFLHQ
jgi:hypothetical protein